MPRPSDVGVGTAVVILNKKGQVLLGKRKGAHAAGCWSVPGGWLDRSDTNTIDAVIREVYEETGLTLQECAQAGWTTEDHPELECRTVTLYHLAGWGSWYGEPVVMEPNKCESWEFFDTDNLPTPMFPGTAGMLHNILDKE